MPTDFYAASGSPAGHAFGYSAQMRAEFTAISTAFAKLPTITGNPLYLVRVNSSGTALESVPVATALASTLSSYLTTATAASTYQPIGSYLTTASAASTYLTIANASSTYATITSDNAKLTTATAAATYATIVSDNAKLPLTGGAMSGAITGLTDLTASGIVSATGGGTTSGIRIGGATVKSAFYDDGSGNVYLDVGAFGSNASVPLIVRAKGLAAISYVVNGAEVGRFNTDGGFLVGGTTPASASGGGSTVLSVNAATIPVVDFLVGGARTGTLLATASEYRMNAVANVPINFYTNNAFRMSISAAGVIADGASNELGYKGLPPNSISASYNIAQTDNGKKINQTTANGVGTTVGMSADFACSIVNTSGSAITIVQNASTTLRLGGTATTGNRTLAAWGVCTLAHVGSNVFIATGAGLT